MSNEQLTPNQLTNIRAGRCPDCGHALMMGPRGGNAMNILCASRRCRQEFNIDSVSGFYGHRNGRASPDRVALFAGKLEPFGGGG